MGGCALTVPALPLQIVSGQLVGTLFDLESSTKLLKELREQKQGKQGEMAAYIGLFFDFVLTKHSCTGQRLQLLQVIRSLPCPSPGRCLMMAAPAQMGWCNPGLHNAECSHMTSHTEPVAEGRVCFCTLCARQHSMLVPQSISCDNVCLLDAEDGKKAAKKAEDSRELAIQARDASRTLQSLSTEVPILFVVTWWLPFDSASADAVVPGSVYF